MDEKYRRLKNGDDSLLKRIHINNGEFLMARESMENGFKKLEYCKFLSWYSLYDTLFKTPDRIRNYHEIIMGDRMQKIYIDIDIDLKDDEFTQQIFHTAEDKLDISKTIFLECARAIKKCRPQITDNDILILNSNSNTKRSYHIIVDRWCFPSATQNKEFFKEMLDHIPLYMRKYFDSQMYSSIRNFRTYMSTKIDGSRILQMDSQSTWKPEELDLPLTELNKEIFCASLVTMIDCCRLLSFKVKEEFDVLLIRDIETVEIVKMMDIFELQSDSNCFCKDRVEDCRIFLKRKSASFCTICDRTHEKQNSYLFLTQKNDVWFNCMRGSKSKLIGNINDITDNEMSNKSTTKRYELPTFESMGLIKPNTNSIFSNSPTSITLFNQNYENETNDVQLISTGFIKNKAKIDVITDIPKSTFSISTVKSSNRSTVKIDDKLKARRDNFLKTIIKKPSGILTYNGEIPTNL